MRQTWAHRLLLLALFLLPWQTRWIFSVPLIGGEASEYGQLSLYATEVLIALVVLLRGRPLYRLQWRFIIQGGYFLLGVAFISLGLSHFFAVGLGNVLHLLFAFALTSALLDTRTDTKSVAVAFVVGLIVPSLLAWWQVLTGSSPSFLWFGLAGKDALTPGTAVVETALGRLLRAYGSFPHPNIFGGYLAVGLVAMAWFLRLIRDRRMFFLSAIPVVLISTTLIVTFSRSAWLGIAVGCLSLIGLMLYRRRIPPSRALPVIALGLVSVLATFGVFYQQAFSRVRVDGRVEMISVTERASQYSRIDDVFFMNPVLGVGPGAYPFVLSVLDEGGRAFAYQPIHNTFLLVLSELGVAGLLALLYLFLRVDQVSAKFSKTAGGMFSLTLGIVLVVIALFDHYLWSLWPGLALGALALAFMVKFPHRP